MNNKRKNRTTMSRYTGGGGEPRQTRGSRSIVPQGVYNNSYFMHGATALVGHLVQVHLRSGRIYEGVFRTFSPVFDVALELPSCIKSVSKNTSEENKNPNCIIFPYDNIVHIVAKDYDPNYVYSGTFQTDSAITEKCNGGSELAEEKELEPWDASGMNGGADFDLDGQNGWDADEMFSKNERNFGLQSTFDHSLSDYTVPIDVKETAEFREAEAKAEKLAQEIESNPSTKDRLNLENGDEEAMFAAVERPPERERGGNLNPQQQQPQPSQQTNSDSVNSSKVPMSVVNNKPKPAVLATPTGNISSSAANNVGTQSSNQVSSAPSNSSSVSSSTNKSTSTLSSGEKYIPPQQKNRKLIQTANSKMTRITSSPNNIPMGHNSSKNYSSGHQSSQQNSGPPQYVTYNVHGSGQYRGNTHNKMNSNDGGNINNNPSKMQQRPVRQYNPSMGSSYNDQQNQVTIINPNHVVVQSHVFVPQTTMTINQGQQHSVPQQTQSQRITNRDEIESLRKFQKDLNIVYSTGNQQQQQSQQQSQGAPNPKNPQPSISPGTQQQQQQVHQKSQIPIQNIKGHVEQQHHQQQQQNITPPQATQQIIQQEQQSYQMKTPPTNVDSQNNSIHNSSGLKPVTSSAADSPSDKTTPPSVTKKHVLNPAAKPFTPRSPSTPTQSRPHTPQTPVPTPIPAAGIFAGPHVQATQHPMYVIQPHPQQTFQQASGHPGVSVQQGRLRRPQLATQMQVSAAAATGQPLLTAPFLHYQQTATHPSHFQTQPYQQMVRYYSEPPPQPVQFLAQTPPSTTPSPGQHQQFHQPQPQPSPQTGAPQQFVPGGQQPPPQPTHYQVVPVIPQQLVSHYYQGAAQHPQQAQQFQIVMPGHATQ